MASRSKKKVKGEDQGKDGAKRYKQSPVRKVTPAAKKKKVVNAKVAKKAGRGRPHSSALPLPDELEGRERERMRKRLWYLANKERRKKQMEVTNRKSHPPSKKQVPVQIRIAKKRKYSVIGGKVYFNVENGFTMAELAVIMGELASSTGGWQ